MAGMLATVLLVLSLLGLAVVAVQLVALAVHLRSRPTPTSHRPGISILKPLRGVDDDLAANLAVFAALDYPAFELLLGVKDTDDPAYRVACAAVARWPERVRVVLQRGEPGLNPKVNQLVTLAAAARHDVLVVSDANVSVAPDYLHGIADAFADPGVGVVTHPISGGGERGLGALFDNLHIACAIGAGVVGARRVLGFDVVVGKSMALRREDLAALGGFASVADVLAEDYVLGRRVVRELGKRVALLATPVVNVSTERSLPAFFRRFVRWGVIHRQAVSLPVYAGEILTNPVALAAASLALDPRGLTTAVTVLVGKTALDGLAGRLLGRRGVGFLLVAGKDLVVAITWAVGLARRTVDWRGHALEVLPGTRLRAPAAPLPSATWDAGR
jgi:ceramide glucosyltransferase